MPNCSRKRRGIDLRRVGSGNVGATNVLRTSGVRPAVLAMMLDAVKGAVAVLIAQRLTHGVAVPVAAGLASVIGHVYPVWLRFHGGKGVATAAGVFAVLTPVALRRRSECFCSLSAVTRLHLGRLDGGRIDTRAARRSPATHRRLCAIGAAIGAGCVLIGHRTEPV